MSEKVKPRVLCVDDEPNVLAGLKLCLGRRFEISTAESGAAALEILERDPGFAVVMSDMRMPGMNGAVLLTRARTAAPEAVRILLTGQADLESAIAAVNEGQLFRFLTKPCPSPVLLGAIEAAAEQHLLITAERVLLEQTLQGSVRALIDVLELTSPLCFGRANRIKQRASALAATLALPARWMVEMAAMLSQLGTISLPAETAERVYYGRPLSEDEKHMLARVPAVTEHLLASIPRLDTVREILAAVPQGGREPEREESRRAAQVLRAALDFDSLDVQGVAAPDALDKMRHWVGRYDDDILAALADTVQTAAVAPGPVRNLKLRALRVGMTIDQDIVAPNGLLFVAKGYQVTPSFLDRAQNFPSGLVEGTIRVILPA